MIEIPATTGEPYTVDLWRGLIVLDRTLWDGSTIRVIFAPDDALAVAHALVDAVEAMS